MQLLKRLLTSVDAIQAMVIALLNLLAVLGAVTLTEVQLGALNLAIVAIARAISKIVYGKDLDDLQAAVDIQSAEAVKLAKADVTSGLPPASEGAVDRGLLEQLLS